MFTINLILNKQFGLSALQWAARNGHPELVTFLLENGALKEITDKVSLIHVVNVKLFGSILHIHTYLMIYCVFMHHIDTLAEL